ncbi:MAG: hypothetical protein NTU97_01610 [Candidatus Magasanikbacteria bacterium]|nr:hypothetical protein [Candidatus Magasanikbacteria bacterium]
MGDILNRGVFNVDSPTEPFEVPTGEPMKADNPLLETRHAQMDEIRDLVGQNDVVVLGIAGCTGNTSAMEVLMSDFKKQENAGAWRIRINRANSAADLDQEVKFKLPGSTANKLLIVDEANNIFSLNDEQKKSFASLFKNFLDQGYKIVFLSHDFTDDGKKFGMDIFTNWVRDNADQGETKKISSTQLETPSAQTMERIFDILVSRSALADDLVQRKKEALDLCTIPLQLCQLVAMYEEEGGGDEVWQYVVTEGIGQGSENFDYFNSNFIQTIGGDKTRALLHHVAESGSLAVADLTEDEATLYERYKAFHILTEEDGVIKVKGKILEEAAKNW